MDIINVCTIHDLQNKSPTHPKSKIALKVTSAYFDLMHCRANFKAIR